MTIIELIKDIYKTEKSKRDEFRGMYIKPMNLKILGTTLRKEERSE